MTYLSKYYKWGHMTKTEVDAIDTAQLTTGDNVYNTDINKEEFWTGDVWTNDDCVVLVNNEGATMNLGNVIGVDPDVSTTDACEFVTDIEENMFVGVIYRGADNGSKVVVAIKGRYQVLFDSATSSVDRQDLAAISSTAGQAQSTAAKTGSTGSFGVIAETFATMLGDDLVYCWLNGGERY